MNVLLLERVETRDPYAPLSLGGAGPKSLPFGDQLDVGRTARSGLQ
jgi:hypothetical protein